MLTPTKAIERIFGDRLATGVYNRQTFKGAMEGLKEELADTRVDIAFSNLLQLVPKFRKSLQTSLSRNVMMELQNITHKLEYVIRHVFFACSDAIVSVPGSEAPSKAMRQ